MRLEYVVSKADIITLDTRRRSSPFHRDRAKQGINCKLRSQLSRKQGRSISKLFPTQTNRKPASPAINCLMQFSSKVRMKNQIEGIFDFYSLIQILRSSGLWDLETSGLQLFRSRSSGFQVLRFSDP